MISSLRPSSRLLTLPVVAVGAILAPVTVIPVVLDVPVTVTLGIQSVRGSSVAKGGTDRGSGLLERSRSRRLSRS